MSRRAKPSRAQCMSCLAASVGESRAAARRRSERRRSSSASDDDGGGFQARCASGEQKGARVGCYLLVQLGPMVQDKEH
jgi:hypothetical protein